MYQSRLRSTQWCKQHFYNIMSIFSATHKSVTCGLPCNTPIARPERRRACQPATSNVTNHITLAGPHLTAQSGNFLHLHALGQIQNQRFFRLDLQVSGCLQWTATCTDEDTSDTCGTHIGLTKCRCPPLVYRCRCTAVCNGPASKPFATKSYSQKSPRGGKIQLVWHLDCVIQGIKNSSCEHWVMPRKHLSDGPASLLHFHHLHRTQPYQLNHNAQKTSKINHRLKKRPGKQLHCSRYESAWP